MGSEFAQFFIGEVIVKEDFVTGDEVAFGIFGGHLFGGSRFCGCFGSGFLGSTFLAELARVTGLAAFSAGPTGYSGTGLLGNLGLSLLCLFFLLAYLAIQDVVYTFFNFVSDVLLGRLFGFFSQPLQNILCIGGAAD